MSTWKKYSIGETLVWESWGGGGGTVRGISRHWLRAPAAQWAFLQVEGDHGVWMGIMGEFGA